MGEGSKAKWTAGPTGEGRSGVSTGLGAQEGSGPQWDPSVRRAGIKAAGWQRVHTSEPRRQG